ncbi:hypothetical protein [Metabacillus sp. RGM 3146]
MEPNFQFYDGSVLPQSVEDAKNELSSLTITDEMRKQISGNPYSGYQKET